MVEDSSNGKSSFWTQANALVRKNLIFQKRNMKTNIRLILFPLVICLLLVLIQKTVNSQLDKHSLRCGCICVDTGKGKCEKTCGIEYSNLDQVFFCPIPHPTEWPLLLQVPAQQFRAVRTGDTCKKTGSCPVTMLITGNNQTFGQSVSGNMFSRPLNINSSDILHSLADNALGSGTTSRYTNFLDAAFLSNAPIDLLQPQCSPDSQFSVVIQLGSATLQKDVRCTQGLQLWRNSSSEINDEIYKGYRNGNSERKINEILAAYDFANSNDNLFNVTVWYNSTYKNNTGDQPPALTRVPRSINLASNAYLQFLLGPTAKMLFEFVKEMPKPETQLRLDFSSLLGPLFFTWVIVQLFPVVLISLVYEKEHKLRIMMKMHGLGDGPYWMISYAYFLAISSIYMLCFVIFGSAIGLNFFRLNDYSIHFVFYFLYINLQICLAFLVADWFSSVKTATVVGYMMVFGTGLLGGFLFQFFLQDSSFPKAGIIAMELFPGFSLYRGLYEFSQYAFTGNFMGSDGMRWKDLNDSNNGMREVLIIIAVEWLVVLCVAYYADQVVSSGKNPLFFLRKKQTTLQLSFRKPSLRRKGSKVFVQMEKLDVDQEREKVEQLLLESSTSHSIICNNLKKIYQSRDGNPEKFAVRELSLALPEGECFGMLGPNGAGKTSFINMMIGLIKPSSGTAYVRGLDIRTDMDKIYTSMGVCPQHDLLWETLTGREHLFFYGRLKNLKGAALTQAVDESLKSVNLFHGGVADKKAGKYSGGMKRRLSVAISLIGDPKVVYMDEPSTGLDPASRNMLWNVVKRAKQNRAIILTTHSMEEAEHLCDRLGIFVDGSLQCVGNPKELKARYGGSYVFTMTTSPAHEEEVANLVHQLSRNATKVYQISGTQKFELPKNEIRIADVFEAVENAKSRFTVQAWGLADTALEDVFIKVARGAQAVSTLS
ncbi:PREDICTED: ABC transporter A family member 7-like isoform X2 [Erythranthe guttata]|uniref:ABC transporter A family member 7-like isoform X2 n=1 Tax=Erythranthe guttata TaxID=4155 RepID=UPI00064DEC9A|nr:PREDICTED: ABC transporter A family member 7-like isoform X2 [Erythranthe guttata]|eukprot:XP_012839386.1 PREDICTED: ABC transporter A family member 7-like isoform X2 [Erythranthe guttata]